MLSVSLDVVLRYFFNMHQEWVVELSEYSVLFITFFGAAWLLKRDGHIKVDILVNLLKPRTRASFSLISSIIGIIICLTFVWYSAIVTIDFVRRDITTAIMLNIPKAPIIAVICFGFFLLLLQFLRNSNEQLRNLKAPPNKDETYKYPEKTY